jgi:hypothetical protein
MRRSARTIGWTGTIGLCCALVAGACEAGPFGSEDAEEDHRFLIDLRNISIEPVTLRVGGETEGFLVQGISVVTIQRGAEPGADLVFEALLVESVVVRTVACRYTPPSDGAPRRRVSWNGAELQCLNWD